MTKTNAFFAAGFSFANASFEADMSAIEAITALAAEITNPAQYQSARGQWVAGYSTGVDCKAASAERQWARLWKLAGGTKPQSDRAALVQAKRTADKADKASPVTVTNPQAPTSGADAADAAKIKVTPDMVHMASLVSACKWAQAHEFLRALEAKAAPF